MCITFCINLGVPPRLNFKGLLFYSSFVESYHFILVLCLLYFQNVGPSGIRAPYQMVWRLTHDHRILTVSYTQLLLHILNCVISQGCMVWVSWLGVDSDTNLLIGLSRPLLSRSFLLLHPLCLLVYIVYLVPLQQLSSMKCLSLLNSYPQ